MNHRACNIKDQILLCGFNLCGKQKYYFGNFTRIKGLTTWCYYYVKQ